MKRVLITVAFIFLSSCQKKTDTYSHLESKASQEYFSYLKSKSGRLDPKEFKDILEVDCQTASGNNTCIGKIFAMKLFLAKGDTLTIEKWSWDTDVKINNTDQLYGFILSYDPAINILTDKDFI